MSYWQEIVGHTKSFYRRPLYKWWLAVVLYKLNYLNYLKSEWNKPNDVYWCRFNYDCCVCLMKIICIVNIILIVIIYWLIFRLYWLESVAVMPLRSLPSCAFSCYKDWDVPSYKVELSGVRPGATQVGNSGIGRRYAVWKSSTWANGCSSQWCIYL